MNNNKISIHLVLALLVLQGSFAAAFSFEQTATVEPVAVPNDQSTQTKPNSLGAYLEEQERSTPAASETTSTTESNAETKPNSTTGSTTKTGSTTGKTQPSSEPSNKKNDAEKKSEKVKAESKSAPQAAFPIGNKISRTIQQVTGINLLTGFIVSHIGQSVLHHKLGGKVKVKIKTYSLTDLLAGKVKSVQVSLQDAKLKGISLGRILISSNNPMWIALPGKGRKAGVKSPVFVAVKAQLSQKDVTEALKSEEVTNQLRGLKLDLPGLGDQQLQVIKPKVEIVDDAVRIEALLITKGGREDTAVPIIISAKPKLLDDARIVLDDMKVTSPDIQDPEQFAAFMQELFNPLVNFARMDTYEHAFRLASLEVGGKTVASEGKLLLVPRDLAKQLAQKGLTK